MPVKGYYSSPDVSCPPRRRSSVLFLDGSRGRKPVLAVIHFPWAGDNKALNTKRTEKILFDGWIRPAIGSIPLGEVAPFHVEKVKKTMVDAGKSARSIEYVLAVVRQIFNHAKRLGKALDISYKVFL